MDFAVAVGMAVFGAVAGWFAAPLAVPYTGELTRRSQTELAAATAAVCGVLGLRFGWSPLLPALLYLAGVGTLLVFIDVAVHRLPDPFTVTGYVIAPVLLFTASAVTDDGFERIRPALTGALALFAIYAVQFVVSPSGIGFGDVKLSGVLGLYLGWFGSAHWWAGLVATYALGGMAAVLTMITSRSRRGQIAFGPYMIAGTLLAVLLPATLYIN